MHQLILGENIVPDLKYNQIKYDTKKSPKLSFKAFVLKAGLEPARALLPTGF